MHILFISDNFPPETNAPATRLFEHARAWVRAGHRVTVVTCAPNFPEGRVHAGYANRWYSRETMSGIEVVRVKTYIAKNQGFVRRTLDYLSFMVAGTIGALFQSRPDVVVASSPQFFAAIAGWVVSVLKRRPFVFEVRDLWPASISAVGAMRGGLAMRALEKVELFLYRRATAIVAVTEAFERDLVERGIDAAKIHVVTNGVDLSTYSPAPRDAAQARAFGVEGRFVVGYLGTHGMAHALHNVLDAAERLRHRDDLCFVFVGAGAARDGLIASASERGLANVVFCPSQPKESMRAVWSVCDVALIHLKNTPVFETVIPSKLFEAMGMGVPVLLAAPSGEASSIVERTSSGVCVGAEDPKALAAAVARLCDDRATTLALGKAARAAAPEFDREALASKMLAVLEGAARRREPVTATIQARLEEAR
jgi:colanic acid biosynthesis glycosyl transferase WcaI